MMRIKEDYKVQEEKRKYLKVLKYYSKYRKTRIFFISDTHFNHKNIIEYCNRPFKNVEEMNKVLIENWNNIVTDIDIVFHLGDVALTSESEMKELIHNLNGKKILIKGNHDTKSDEFFKKAGFEYVYQGALTLNEEKILLSHKPIKDSEVPDGYINIHGHIHNKMLNEVNPITNEMEYPEELYSKNSHINVSVGMINYKPISWKELLDMVENKALEEGK